MYQSLISYLQDLGNLIAALHRAGFVIENPGGNNPRYTVSYADNAPPLTCFSKTFDDPVNPRQNFVAVMTCSEADQNCPLIPGARLRVSLSYEDPKIADGIPEQQQVYDERCRHIATEMYYIILQSARNSD